MPEMAFKRYHTLSLAFVTTVALLLLANRAEARFRGINSFCTTADQRLLCTRMVHGATNWHDAVANAINTSLELATTVKSMLPRIGPLLTDLTPESRDSTIQTCAENFDSAVDNLKEALTYLNAGDKGSLNTYLSSVTISDCMDAFDQFSAPFPDILSKAARILDRQVNNILAVSQQI
ncbi:hypothetical protein RJ640_016103 [Escallonia rubra]|uniref:Pectinesterase inhibitor domain-containing protein n=1 Tax=Escallonia rubra TaxID=112253 RepID=A0AA88UAX3_9ASTE|nr:hypothetical protein RJ640_016103 [Escallonia rubra]